ncbi:hypothetical protein DM01DRAFT_1335302 [Hesseltinella vesiculosa]|uniref:Uncharacterized protein n=1 Tax=Hesseltinella vesiculosa TaxID=101127 RepID=A0A1X2GJ85_9FUNG|nr:hypothetical protein DM01DRAFT_1335302 [Hesseltinella vesiculosa]
MNRGPLVLTIDEAELLLDQMPPPDKDEAPLVTKLRARLRDFLVELRRNAEGTPQ